MSARSKVHAHRPGRLCGQEGCDTVLSIYNPAALCSLHDDAHDEARTKECHRKGTTVTRNCAHESCESSFETANQFRVYCSDHCRMAAFALRRTSGAFKPSGSVAT
jgi:hypothetical protein